MPSAREPKRREEPTAFLGPVPPARSQKFDDPNELLGAFATAQRQSTRKLPPWCDHKTQRKHVWRRMGVSDHLLVPTLYAGEMTWDGETEEMPEFVDDGEGNFMPCLDAGKPLQAPADPACRETLRTLLARHGELVIKPAIGANSKGCLLYTSPSPRDS